jgi:hypothetical protein
MKGTVVFSLILLVLKLIFAHPHESRLLDAESFNRLMQGSVGASSESERSLHESRGKFWEKIGYALDYLVYFQNPAVETSAPFHVNTGNLVKSEFACLHGIA